MQFWFVVHQTYRYFSKKVAASSQDGLASLRAAGSLFTGYWQIFDCFLKRDFAFNLHSRPTLPFPLLVG